MEHDMNQRVITYGPEDENLWYPPYDWIDYTSSNLYSDELSESQKYGYYLYYSLMYLTLNEIGPNNVETLIVCNTCLVGASLIYTLLLGEMIMLIATLDKENTIYQMKVDHALSDMIYIKLDFDAQNEIKDYYKKTEIKKDK